MQRLLRDGLAAGALGFSSTWSTTHNDADGVPVPSRFAEPDELVALAAVCGEFPGTSREFLSMGAVAEFDERNVGAMARMSAAAQRPLNWNVFLVSARGLPDAQAKLAASDAARAMGGKVVALTLPITIMGR